MLLVASLAFAVGAIVAGQIYSSNAQKKLLGASTEQKVESKQTEAKETTTTDSLAAPTQSTGEKSQETGQDTGNKELDKITEDINKILQKDGTFNPDTTAEQIYRLESQLDALPTSTAKSAQLEKMTQIKNYFGLE